MRLLLSAVASRSQVARSPTDRVSVRGCVASVAAVIGGFQEASRIVSGAQCAERIVSKTRRSDNGAKRDRTADLLRAKQALSQLSYGPGGVASVVGHCRRAKDIILVSSPLMHNGPVRYQNENLALSRPP